MKRIIGLLLLFTVLSCKKQSEDTLTSSDWLLESATVSPAMTIGSKTSTDYKNLFGPGSCLASNYTLSFNNNGTYTSGSNGALCDLLVSTEASKWSIDGNTINLSGSGGFKQTATLANKSLTYTSVSTNNDVTYTIVYIFKAKSR